MLNTPTPCDPVNRHPWDKYSSRDSCVLARFSKLEAVSNVAKGNFEPCKIGKQLLQSFRFLHFLSRVYHSIFSLTYLSINSSTPMFSNLSLFCPNSTNSFIFSFPKCGPRCLSNFSKISGFASVLLNLCPNGASTTSSSNTDPSFSVTVNAFGMVRMFGLWYARVNSSSSLQLVFVRILSTSADVAASEPSV